MDLQTIHNVCLTTLSLLSKVILGGLFWDGPLYADIN